MRALLTAFAAACAIVPCASASVAWKPGSPQDTLVHAERVLQHDARWRPTSIYCLRPTRSAYGRVAGAVEKTYRCQWVKQNNPRPWEIDVVQMVYARGGHSLFSLVSSNYGPPRVRPALCRVAAAGGGYRTSCHPK